MHFCKNFLNKMNKKAAIGFIFFTLVLDVTGLGLIIPVLPKLISQLINGSVSDAAKWGGYLTAAYAIMQFLFAPVLGGLSDKYGRRPVNRVAFFLVWFWAGLSFFIICPYNRLALCGQGSGRYYRCKFYNCHCIYC